jgi:hypothetical protein
MKLAQFWPLNKVTDGDRWNAESLVGRLGIVAHAAFLYTGFRPHAAQPAPSEPWSLSCRYSLKQPAHRGGIRDTIVMHLSGQEQGSVALHTYVSRKNRRHRKLEMPFDNADLAKALSGDVDKTARDLRTPGSAASWLWRVLADELCQGLFLHVCRTNGVPVAGFASLPGDVKAVILAKLDSAKDLVSVECASKEMKELVAEHDADIWKPMYEGIKRCVHCRLVRNSELEGRNLSWKKRYAEARGMRCQSVQCFLLLLPRKMFTVTYLDSSLVRGEALLALATADWSLHDAAQKSEQDSDANHYFATQCNGYRGKTISCRNLHPRPGPESCILYRRRHGAGAIHSPSSRYRWKHR